MVTSSLEGGGAERAMAEMASYWAEKGWRITLATWTGSEVQDFYSLAPGVKRVWLDVHSPSRSALGKLASNLTRALKLRALLRESRPDAVLSFIDVSNVLTILATLGLKQRVVVSERGCPDVPPENGLYPLSRFWRILRRCLYCRAAVVTALNNGTAAWIRKECGVEAKVVPLALRSLPEAATIRESSVLGVGRLHAVKGFDLLIRAFAAISANFPAWRLILIGNGPQKQALVELCAELNLVDRVEFVNPVQDVETWMARAGLVVLPSRSEAFGNVLLESMGMGASVISTNCSGPASLIHDGVNGRLVPVNDVDALTRAMLELMSQPDTRAQLGREACQVRQRFSQEAIMAQWEVVLLNRPKCAD
jgi:GalNAc-alpha-(1->4)-GalNAc-alpha-(1->3)-diNAcBac-PP-undecaprenol alpha-1,4-N-acetyl-D-galactosaminyltransferase